MIKKRLAKLIPAMCIVSMIFSMTACSKGDTKTDTTAKTTGGETTAGTEQTTAGSGETTESGGEAFDPMAKYEDPVTITTVVGLSDAMQQYMGVKDDVQTNNSWYNGYERDLGIKVENVWSVPGTQYKDKLNAQISADDLPDVFNVSMEQLKTLVDNGMVMDLTELFDTYATDFTKQMMEDDDYTALSQCKLNDKLYALPNVSGNRDGVPIMWIRKDWMEKLGKKAPTTAQELQELAKAFVTEDPDGNGKADTYGIALSKDLYGNAFCDMTGILEIFGGHVGWVEKDGKAEYSLIQPEVKTALENMNRWYQDGIFNKEFVAKDTSKVSEDVVAGTVGITFGSHGNAFWPFPDAKNLNPEADWMPYPIPGLDGNLPQVMVGSSAAAYYVVNSECKNPEAVMKMYNYFYQKDCALSPDYDETYHITGSTAMEHPEWAMDWAVLKSFYPQQNLFIHRGVTAYLNGDSSQMENAWVSSNAEQVEGYVKDPVANQTFYSTYIWSGPEGAFSVVDSYEKNNQRLQNLYILGNTDGMAMYNVTLEQLIKEAFTKIITGEKPISAFDEFVSQWKSLGGDQITQEVNELLGR